jgi:hypothetical protein
MLGDSSSKKTDPVLHAFPALKGPFSRSFHHFCGVILYVNFLFFTPCLGAPFLLGTGDIGSAGHEH